MRTIREGQSFLGKKEFLAGESCEGAGEFLDLQCQINTMLHVGYLKGKTLEPCMKETLIKSTTLKNRTYRTMATNGSFQSMVELNS